MLEAYFTEKNYNWKSLEVGPRLRKYTETDPTAFKERVRKVMREGGLVPSALPIALLVQYMDEQKTMSDHLTIDGYSGRKLIEAEIAELNCCCFSPILKFTHSCLLCRRRKCSHGLRSGVGRMTNGR